jgi:hypothetical protein
VIIRRRIDTRTTIKRESMSIGNAERSSADKREQGHHSKVDVTQQGDDRRGPGFKGGAIRRQERPQDKMRGVGYERRDNIKIVNGL